MQILAPVVLIITMGWALVRTGFLSTPAVGELNRLTYWVGLPALLIQRIGTAAPDFGRVGDMLSVLLLATGVSVLVAAFVARLWRLPGRSFVTFVHGAYRGNLTFVGLPVVIYAFAGSPEASTYEAVALVAFVPLVVIYNIVAVTVMQLPGRQAPMVALSRVARGVGTNPILLGTLLGVLLALSPLALPLAADRTLAAVGQMALPLALIGIGAGLYATRIRGRVRWAVGAAALKTTVGPLAGLFFGVTFGLSTDELRLALVFLACPTASAAYVLVQQMDGDTALVASTIVLSHLFALPVMLLVLALTA
ncbi:auxin efflux carrier [Spiribacter salinus M19-40]|uniref:Auxin efflux carrier n=1 Tax=Spiribacter salinus M19-40 TaxID=1260251 RepID=R4VK25_9GAMM|nr:AEC family transporter [Spiribacter salinus]AGM40867.1 auxin efflux carrier [Spiribacter salinus M19-40]MBY5268099.1 hypothetical protein [Spiribacter salinus]